jgi:hypothetical protein
VRLNAACAAVATSHVRLGTGCTLLDAKAAAVRLVTHRPLCRGCHAVCQLRVIAALLLCFWSFPLAVKGQVSSVGSAAAFWAALQKATDTIVITDHLSLLGWHLFWSGPNEPLNTAPSPPRRILVRRTRRPYQSMCLNHAWTHISPSAHTACFDSNPAQSPLCFVSLECKCACVCITSHEATHVSLALPDYVLSSLGQTFVPTPWMVSGKLISDA